MPAISEAELQEVKQEIAHMSRSQATIALCLVFEELAKNPDLFHTYHRFLEFAFQLAG